jgi:hypothetical protein
VFDADGTLCSVDATLAALAGDAPYLCRRVLQFRRVPQPRHDRQRSDARGAALLPRLARARRAHAGDDRQAPLSSAATHGGARRGPGARQPRRHSLARLSAPSTRGWLASQPGVHWADLRYGNIDPKTQIAAPARPGRAAGKLVPTSRHSTALAPASPARHGRARGRRRRRARASTSQRGFRGARLRVAALRHVAPAQRGFRGARRCLRVPRHVAPAHRGAWVGDDSWDGLHGAWLASQPGSPAPARPAGARLAQIRNILANSQAELDPLNAAAILA